MQIQDANPVNEIDRLKKKCNIQIDHIKMLQTALNQAQKELEEYQKSVEENARKNNGNSDAFPDENPDVFSLAARLFRQTFTAPVIQNSYLDDRKSNIQNRPYKILEYALLMRVLENLITTNSVQISAQKTAQYWANIGLIHRDSRSKITYTFSLDGSPIRTVRVNKAALLLLSEALQ